MSIRRPILPPISALCALEALDRHVNRHARESHIQRSFRTHCGTEGQLGGAAGPARSSRRKSTLLAVPSLLDDKELLDEKDF